MATHRDLALQELSHVHEDFTAKRATIHALLAIEERLYIITQNTARYGGRFFMDPERREVIDDDRRET